MVMENCAHPSFASASAALRAAVAREISTSLAFVILDMPERICLQVVSCVFATAGRKQPYYLARLAKSTRCIMTLRIRWRHTSCPAVILIQTQHLALMDYRSIQIAMCGNYFSKRCRALNWRGISLCDFLPRLPISYLMTLELLATGD